MKRLLLCVLLLTLFAASPTLATEAGTPCSHLVTGPPAALAAYRQGVASFYEGQADAAASAFRDALKAVPNCALLHSWLSRALLKGKHHDEAYSEQNRADTLMEGCDDREQRICYAWSWHLKALDLKGNAAFNAFDRERGILDYGIVVYPDDADLWALRGDAAESALRAAPYRIFLLKLDPSHPLGKVWKPPVTKAPPLASDGKFVTVSGPATPPKLFDGLGNLHHAITTVNPLAQKYYEQGLRCFHAYVSPGTIPNGAAQCFQYALKLDPHCAMAQWGLTFCLTAQDKAPPLQLAQSAYALALAHGTDKERRFCAARALEVAGPKYRTLFLDALDGAICAYPDDVELWIWRGKVYGDYGAGPEDEAPSIRVLAGMSFELAAVHMHPEHPSPNHELIHDYEAIDRPDLGWPYTVGFRKAAPNMPHAQHMQAHLAMRLGRWDDALDATEASYRLSQAGYPELDPSHHLYVRVLALAHEGHFKEIEKTTPGAADNICWARMLRLMADEKGLEKWARDHVTKEQSADNVYMAALVDLDQGDVKDAAKFVDMLAAVVKQKKYNVYNYIEARARCLIGSGKADEGFDLFRNTAAKAVSDANLHFFGGGGYFPEVWGEEALRHGRWADAALAFSEALAHDHGSIVGALGMQVVAEQRGQSDLVGSYAARAALMWKGADAGALQRQLERLRGFARTGQKHRS